MALDIGLAERLDKSGPPFDASKKLIAWLIKYKNNFQVTESSFFFGAGRDLDLLVPTFLYERELPQILPNKYYSIKIGHYDFLLMGEEVYNEFLYATMALNRLKICPATWKEIQQHKSLRVGLFETLRHHFRTTHAQAQPSNP